MLLRGTIDTVYKGPMETPVNSTVPTMTPAPTRVTVVYEISHFQNQFMLWDLF